MGVEHNILLEKYYTAILSLSETDRLDRQILENTIITVSNNYSSQNSSCPDEFNMGISFISEENYSFVEGNLNNMLPNNLPGSLISIEAKSYLQDLFTLLNQDIDLSSFQEGIQNILIEVNSNITNNNEKYILLTSLSIAKHSMNYWNKNFTNWQNLNPSNSDPEAFSWSTFGKADVMGATGFAVTMTVNGTYAAMAAGGPAGWVGAGLATVGAGAAASCVYGIYGSLIDWW